MLTLLKKGLKKRRGELVREDWVRGMKRCHGKDCDPKLEVLPSLKQKQVII